MKHTPTIEEDLYTRALKLLYPLSEKATYSVVAQEAKDLVDAKYASIFLFEKGAMKRIYATSRILFTIIPRKNGYTMRAYREAKFLKRNRKQLSDTYPIFKKLQAGWDVVVPLVYENKVFGVLSIIGYKDGHFTKNCKRKLQLFTPLATLAIRETLVREKLRKALKQRDLFISLAAHELKTPLTSTLLYMQILTSTPVLSKSREKTIKQKLSHGLKRLSYLINEFLQINKMQLGALEFVMEKKSLRDIAQRAITEFNDAYDTHSIHFTDGLDGKDFIRADEDKIIHVITNLLSNAAKYSDDNTSIDISLSQKGKKICMAVTDHGKGIHPSDMKKIFNQFYQGRNTNKEGLGLGLYLVRYIIQKHHGRIQVDSHVGKGTTMTIELPTYTTA
ncbi:MAG TPA: GAF domain-containing sensor histidine kinase [Candidatus Eisenbacteria bacterium]|nr:GAF domain-containing sensor histidine kinase [Candidatus Eisenbacteria bacterium]